MGEARWSGRSGCQWPSVETLVSRAMAPGPFPPVWSCCSIAWSWRVDETADDDTTFIYNARGGLGLEPVRLFRPCWTSFCWDNLRIPRSDLLAIFGTGCKKSPGGQGLARSERYSETSPSPVIGLMAPHGEGDASTAASAIHQPAQRVRV